MKNGKRLSVKMMKILSSNGLDYKDYLYVKNLNNELHVVHRVTGEVVVIKYE